MLNERIYETNEVAVANDLPGELIAHLKTLIATKHCLLSYEGLCLLSSLTFRFCDALEREEKELFEPFLETFPLSENRLSRIYQEQLESISLLWSGIAELTSGEHPEHQQGAYLQLQGAISDLERLEVSKEELLLSAYYRDFYSLD